MTSMTPEYYQRLAARTECNQEDSIVKAKHFHPQSTRLLHAALGLAGDAGEVASCIERWIYYGGPLDRTNLKEELGDCLWYIAQACNALECDLSEVMRMNITKLRARYPEKFESKKAEESNRNRSKEREAMETVCSTCNETVTEDPGCVACEGDRVCPTEYVDRTKYKGNICPHCSGPISDETVRKVVEGILVSGMCPNCTEAFTVGAVGDEWVLVKS